MELLTSRRAELLEQALGGAAPSVPRQGVERELALVHVLQRAGAVTAPAPTAEFRAALRGRLVAVAAVRGADGTGRPPAPAVSWRRRLAAVAAGLTASAVAVTGVAVAADRSLPGDPFYGVKRVTEDVQLRLAAGPAEQGRRHLQFAAERVGELRRLALGRDLAGRDEPLSGADAARVRALLDDLDAETRSASRLLTEAFRAGDAAPVQELAAFAAAARGDLTGVLPALPAGVRPRLVQSLEVVGDVRTAATELLLRDCATGCDPATRAPVLPPLPGTPAVEEPCPCPTPPPGPSVAPPAASSPPAGSTAEPTPAEPTPSGSARRSPAASPKPSPTEQPGLPLPSPLPSPLWSPLSSPLSSPAATVPLPPLPPLDPVVPDGGLPVPPLTGDGGLLGAPSGALPAVAPVPGALVLVLRAWRG